MFRLPVVLAILASQLADVVQSQNTFCNASSPIDAFPFGLSGSTVGLSGYQENACESFGYHGLWFEMEGDGQCYSVVLDASSEIESVRKGATIMSGPSCTDLTCAVTESTFSDDDFKMVFSTEEGTSYRVLVSSVDYNSDYAGTALTGEIKPTACSGACSGAIQVPPLPASLTGDTSLTESGSDIYGACGISDDNKVEFYKLTGTGSCVMAEVESSDFRPKLVFYTGPCPYLECYHQALTDYIYEDDPRAPGFLQEAKSTLIPTSDGIEYTIGVAGVEGNESGTYSLMLTETECPPAPTNVACDSAQVIDEFPFETEGTFAVAPTLVQDQVSNCSTFYDYNADTRVGLWFEFVGNGRCVYAGTESTSSRAIGVYAGDCDNLVCMSDRSYYNNFRAELGVTYRIVVAGEAYKGRFKLTLRADSQCETDAPVNNNCTGATVVDSLPFFEIGETIGATRNEDQEEDDSVCDANMNPRGKIVWYEFEGDGSCYTASTAGSDFDTAIAVYRGECNGLECLSGSDDTTIRDATTRLSWETEVGVRYKLAVGGSGSFDAGVYNLNVTSSGACPQVEMCSLCFDGSIPPEGLTFDGDGCRELATEAQATLTAASGDCARARQIGVSFCGCNVPASVNEVCNLCGQDGFVPNPNVILDEDVEDVVFNCNALINAPKFTELECDVVADLNEVCECTESDFCTFCPGNALPQDPEAVNPAIFGEQLSCAEWQTRAEAQAFPECTAMTMLPFDIASFCCPRAAPPGVCSFCDQGEEIIDGSAEIPSIAGVTCSMAEESAKYFTAQGCDDLAGARSFCCSSVEATNTSTPTLSPVVTAPEGTFAPSSAPVKMPATAPVAAPAVTPTATTLAPTSTREKEIPTGSPVFAPTSTPSFDSGASLIFSVLSAAMGVSLTLVNL